MNQLGHNPSIEGFQIGIDFGENDTINAPMVKEFLDKLQTVLRAG